MGSYKTDTPHPRIFDCGQVVGRLTVCCLLGEVAQYFLPKNEDLSSEVIWKTGTVHTCSLSPGQMEADGFLGLPGQPV